MSEVIIPSGANVFSWRNAYLFGAVAALAYERSEGTWSGVLKTTYGFDSVKIVNPADSLEVNLIFLDVNGYTIVGLEGTTNADQIIQYGLIDQPAEHMQPGFWFPGYFYDAGNTAASKIASNVGKGRPLILCGHSLGGAAASIAGEVLRRSGYNVYSVWTYGSPRPGNQNFAAAYSLPNFRVFSALDIVPRLPPESDYIIKSAGSLDWAQFGMKHVGEDHSVYGDTLSEEIIAALSDYKSLGFYHLAVFITDHLMGAYMEGIWGNLSDDERGGFQPLFDELVGLGSQGKPTTLPPGSNATPPDALVADALNSEATTLASCLGESAICSVQLFTSPAAVPADPLSVPYLHPTFPGYATQTLPGTTAIEDVGDGIKRTAWAEVTFTATDNPTSGPETIYGAALIVNKISGGSSLLKAFDFVPPKLVSAKGDKVSVKVRLTCSRVQA